MRGSEESELKIKYQFSRVVKRVLLLVERHSRLLTTIRLVSQHPLERVYNFKIIINSLLLGE